MPKNYGKKKRTHKAAMIMIFFVVAFFCGTLYISNRSSEEELDKLNEEKDKLMAQIEDEEKRTLELEELRVYVKTMKYVEERAKQLGLVYPNEIIYKPK
ncbi:MAG: septum formation initiator family protein [Lachnospiraceae bacterium]|nr:septum formation initiator family protein [Lachnospiraceae bacterium]